MDCSVSGKCPPDSAYYTKSPATQSIFSGEFPGSSQHSLTGAMSAMELPNEQMSYMPYPPERLSRVSQEAPGSYAKQGFAEHPAENSHELEWYCGECESNLNFKNKSEFKYAQPKL